MAFNFLSLADHQNSQKHCNLEPCHGCIQFDYSPYRHFIVLLGCQRVVFIMWNLAWKMEPLRNDIFKTTPWSFYVQFITKKYPNYGLQSRILLIRSTTEFLPASLFKKLQGGESKLLSECGQTNTKLNNWLAQLTFRQRERLLVSVRSAVTFPKHTYQYNRK